MFKPGDLVSVARPNRFAAFSGDYEIVSVDNFGYYRCWVLSIELVNRGVHHQTIHVDDLIPIFCPFPLLSKLERLI